MSDQTLVDGVSVAELCLGGCKVTFYDLVGGAGWLGRAMLGSYYTQSHGLVFVVDLWSIHKSLQDTRVAITDVLQHTHIAGKAVLLLANKQDLSGALGEVELIHCLSLEKLVNRHQCRCLIKLWLAVLGSGRSLDKSISERVEWLLDYISHDYKPINERVQMDTAHKRTREEDKRKREEIACLEKEDR
ncbi:ADP-ribosylation factor-like protein 13B [Oncorhynchus keta]|uniref:ADP-ribosylation factor-like protein 13B n=1 Tax=Oncorhynchus keta TaxID=8018 RepID=UPI00227B74CC|nr:ADP-ribosylation factor-like protein 13B [Oncorhynchus keta]